MATQEQFEKRRQRYERKQHRQWKARPRGPIGGYGDDGGGSHRGRPWLYETFGKMKPLNKLVSYHPFGPTFGPYIGFHFDLTTDGVHRTPHLHRNPVLAHDAPHPQTALSNYFHRRRTAFGKKIGKLNGFERRCWCAWKNAQAWARTTGGVRYWPAWDPLHRTPVQP